MELAAPIGGIDVLVAVCVRKDATDLSDLSDPGWSMGTEQPPYTNAAQSCSGIGGWGTRQRIKTDDVALAQDQDQSGFDVTHDNLGIHRHVKDPGSAKMVMASHPKQSVTSKAFLTPTMVASRPATPWDVIGPSEFPISASAAGSHFTSNQAP